MMKRVERVKRTGNRKKGMINDITTDEFLAPGHRGCSGCGAAITARYALKAAGKDTIVVSATGCLEVFTTPYPETSWRVPWIHAAFENAASVASGIHRALIMQGRRKNTNILVLAGDGGTFDIGFQFISGAFERRERICYICYDNGAYMNTGIQRSGATPRYAATTTSPAGKKVHGKTEQKKNLPLIFAAHGVYVATATIAFPQELVRIVKKALSLKGPSYIQVYSPCPTGWKHPTSMSVQVAKRAFDTGISPLFEIEDGVLRFYKKPSKRKPVGEYLMMEGRWSHLSQAEKDEIQKQNDDLWDKLEALESSRVRI